ncbi:MAG TPA: PHP domain-containing protein [Myxococcaceae bacterium]|nr:PHP domain-containing protein [Myxococcaceae bacterium]
MIDLHAHTTASDGQHPPIELMAIAARAGVTHLAVTDHDTVAGLAEADSAAQAHGISLIPGIEVSAYIGRREVHVLGHFVDRDNPELQAYSVRLRSEREARMRRMVEQVQKLGYAITFEEVEKVAAGGQMGRPHLAQVLLERGICSSFQEAFERFLTDGKPGFVDRERLTAADAIALIRQAGGVATVAHPGASRLDRPEITAMREAGLDGIEVHHGDHAPGLREKYLHLARDLNLIPTAGSDFHGETVTPHRKLGSAAMAPQLFAALAARATP